MLRYFLSFIILFFPVTSQAETAFDRVTQKGEIKCGYGTYAPYIARNLKTNEMEGIVVDLANAVAKHLDFKLIWGEETGWGNIPTSLKNGRVDMACSSLYTDPKRGKLVAFTEPIFYQALHVYVREEDNRFSDDLIEALNSKDITFSMIDGGYSLAVVKRLFPQANYNSLPQISNWSEVMLNVANGKADAIISDPIFIADFNKNNQKKLKRVSLSEPVAVFGNSFAVGIQETEFKEMINNTVRYMIQTGEVDQLTKDFRSKYPDAMILPQKPYLNSN